MIIQASFHKHNIFVPKPLFFACFERSVVYINNIIVDKTVSWGGGVEGLQEFSQMGSRHLFESAFYICGVTIHCTINRKPGSKLDSILGAFLFSWNCQLLCRSGSCSGQLAGLPLRETGQLHIRRQGGSRYIKRHSLKIIKVVSNEKSGGSGGWLLFEDGFGPWRSMSVFFFILLSSFLQRISVSLLKSPVNRQLAWK